MKVPRICIVTADIRRRAAQWPMPWRIVSTRDRDGDMDTFAIRDMRTQLAS
jgi:hypothetical protein